MKFFYSIIDFLYQLSRVIRSSLLLNQFGYVSQCPHQPSCGQYTTQLIKERGLVGLFVGLKRASKCLLIPNLKE